MYKGGGADLPRQMVISITVSPEFAVYRLSALGLLFCLSGQHGCVCVKVGMKRGWGWGVSIVQKIKVKLIISESYYFIARKFFLL